MTDFNTLTDLHRAPEGAKPSLVRKLLIDANTNRRRMLKLMTGAGMAVGLGAVGTIPLSKPRKAYAAPYEEWLDTCRGYFNINTTCVPQSAYYGSDNCAPGTDWHREDTVTIDACNEVRYTHVGATCDGRNAWTWEGRGRAAKCSDGYRTTVNTCTGAEFRAFSICRTYLDEEPEEPRTLPIAPGTYRIENVTFGNFLDGSAPGRVDLDTDEANAATVWEVIAADDGLAFIKNVGTGEYLRFATTRRLETSGAQGSDAEWEIVAEGDGYLIRNLGSGRNLDADSGNRLDTNTGTGADKQWRFVPATPVEDPEDPEDPVDGELPTAGTYRIENVAFAGKLLTANAGGVTLSDVANDESLWDLTFTADGYAQMRNRSLDQRIRNRRGNMEMTNGTGRYTQWTMALTNGNVTFTNRRTGANFRGDAQGTAVVESPWTEVRSQWKFIAA